MLYFKQYNAWYLCKSININHLISEKLNKTVTFYWIGAIKFKEFLENGIDHCSNGYDYRQAVDKRIDDEEEK